MSKLKKLWHDLRTSPVDTLVDWQERRLLWIVMAIAMGALVVVAHSFFQVYLYMKPCEQCVYIRFAMLVMAAGGIIAAINPKVLVLKVIGVVFALYGAVTGLQYSIKLNGIHHAAHSDDLDALFGVQGCSAEPSFPFGLPLDKWMPDMFRPTGDCGYDAPYVPDGTVLSSIQEWWVSLYTAADGWYLIPPVKFMNMAQACGLAFGICLIVFIIMIAAWGIKLARGGKR